MTVEIAAPPRHAPHIQHLSHQLASLLLSNGCTYPSHKTTDCLLDSSATLTSGQKQLKGLARHRAGDGAPCSLGRPAHHACAQVAYAARRSLQPTCLGAYLCTLLEPPGLSRRHGAGRGGAYTNCGTMPCLPGTWPPNTTLYAGLQPPLGVTGASRQRARQHRQRHQTSPTGRSNGSPRLGGDLSCLARSIKFSTMSANMQAYKRTPSSMRHYIVMPH